MTPIELFEKHFWKPFPRRKTTPTIQGSKSAIRKKLEKAVSSGETTWEDIKVSVEAYAKSDKVAQGFVQMPETWVNKEGWNYEYEIPQSAEEILAAKPLSERTLEDWREKLGVTTEFNKHWLGAHPDEWRGAPTEILEEYGLRKQA